MQFERFRAAQYSRELSDKVWRGCVKITEQGYWAGGSPPYGTRRLLLDERREPLHPLEPGQRKGIQNQRVTLVEGDPVQVAVIQRIYADLWELDWSVHARFAKLLIDGVIYSHGDSGRAGQDAALAQAKDQFRSTVIGHFHSQAGVKWWANPEFRVFGMSVGCGIDASRLQFEYGRRIVERFAHDAARALWRLGYRREADLTQVVD